jgi:biotin transporter BioY
MVGFLVEHGVARSTWKLVGALVSADVMILLAGSTWLRLLFRVPFAQAWLLGFYPFLIADVVKVALVGGVLPRVVRGSGDGRQLSVVSRQSEVDEP